MIEYNIAMFPTTLFLKYATLIFCNMVLPHKLSVKKIAISGFLLSLLPAIRIFFSPDDAIVMTVGMSITIISLALQILLFKGRLLQRAMAVIFFTLMEGVSEIVAWGIFQAFDINPLTTHDITIASLVFGVIICTLYITFGYISIPIWRMMEVKKFQPFLILPILQPISMVLMFITVYFDASYILAVIASILGLVVSVVLMVYVANISKKAAIEEELRETRNAMALEQSHYRHVEERREELAKIRHDFNNQLAVIGRLLDAGDEGNAQNMVATLAKEVMETKENVFCNIPVVNAILLEKSQVCDAEQIKLTTKLDLPPTIAMEQIHLCSIFSNLLDNAIRACKNTHVAPPPEILLAAKQEGDYLFIKMQNPSQNPPAKPAAGHGLGLRIVRDLAQQYGGDFHAEYKDGVFTDVVSVEI